LAASDWHRWPNWTAFQKQLPAGARLWLIESKGPRHYAEARYQPGDYLVFGRETAGLPPKSSRNIPMAGCAFRCLTRVSVR
jgi:tRNA(Leu) C34 or U34 (ribose-2'-O)-methylase TrmL